MVYFHTPHRSPETETPGLEEIIAEAVHNTEACHANGRLFCGQVATNSRQRRVMVEQELLHIAHDYHFLYDVDPEPVYAALRDRFDD
jgi:hypothetical protein